MDAAIASVTATAAPVRRTPEPLPAPRVEPPSPAAATGDRAPSFASEAAYAAESRLTAERAVDRDPATDSLVYRLIDLSSGMVTLQTPSDARLKLRAYLDGVIAASDRGSAIEVTA